MNQKGSSEASSEADSNTKEAQSVVLGLWGVRYQVKDVSRSVALLYKTTWSETGSAKLTCFRPGLGRQSETHSQWSRRFGFSSDA